MEDNKIIRPQNNVKKLFNKKIIIGACAVAAALIMVIFIAPSAYALFSPTEFVKNTVSKSLENLLEDNKKFAEAPSLLSILANNESATQKELNVNIDGITNMSVLEDCGFNIKQQTNKDNTAGNLYIALLDGKNEIIGGRIYADSKLLAVEAPKLFEDILGVDLKNAMNNLESDSGSKEFNEAMDMISEMLTSPKKINEEVREIYEKYSKLFLKMLKFKNDKSDKSLYTATVAGDDIVKLAKSFATELMSNKQLKEYLVSYMYMSEGYYTEDYYRDYVDNMVAALPDEIDYMLENVTVEDLNVDVIIKDRQAQSLDLSLRIKSYDEVFKLKYSMDLTNDKNNKGVNFNLKFGVGSYDSIEGSIMFVKEAERYNRRASISLNAGEIGSMVTIDIDDSLYDKKKYDSSLSMIINDGSDDVIINFAAEGSYKNKSRIDYSNVELSVAKNQEALKINLSGYASVEKIKSIDSINEKRIVYIDEMDEVDLNELYEEIIRNIYMLINRLDSLI